MTLAFSRHIIGVASEQKKCTEAKNEQKQKSNKKLHKKRKRPFLAGGRFFDLEANSMSKIKTPDRHDRELLLVELAGIAPASKW
ncbi:MAG: hypothetical protein WBK76_05460 [Candidatus Saccharimonadales bacterium]